MSLCYVPYFIFSFHNGLGCVIRATPHDTLEHFSTQSKWIHPAILLGFLAGTLSALLPGMNASNQPTKGANMEMMIRYRMLLTIGGLFGGLLFGAFLAVVFA